MVVTIVDGTLRWHGIVAFGIDPLRYLREFTIRADHRARAYLLLIAVRRAHDDTHHLAIFLVRKSLCMGALVKSCNATPLHGMFDEYGVERIASWRERILALCS